MSDSEQNNPVPSDSAQAAAQAQRLPLFQQLSTSVGYMRESANTEFKRAGDVQNALLLPISCLLLVVAICMSCPAPLRMVSFMVPLFCFSYYIANRIGIVRTFNARQAYLTWHVLIATFLLGGTFALFLVYAGTTMMMYATKGQ